ncbi:carbohydrate esterase family 16 protein [Chiua virens]|nr:carbohydrate esterase family 16 protein [Chiua virens]
MIVALGFLYPLLGLYGLQKLVFVLIQMLRLSPGSHDKDVRLAVHPQCGPLSGDVSDVNAGLDLANVKAIVSFGDSYTDGGRQDGGPLAPAVLVPPNPFAGGRSTNGKIWVEHIADSVGAELMDYAWSSAVTNISLWPSNPYPRDFIMQTTTFLEQSNKLDPDTTLYTIFFGIKSVSFSSDGNHLLQAAQDLLAQMKLLSQPPTNARNFLVTDVYGLGTQDTWGEAWLQAIFDGLIAFRVQDPPLNVAFVNFAAIWNGVLGPDPGHRAFGYDPDHHFYWFVK